MPVVLNMPKRLGFIQTRGIGDVIIALPIADYYIDGGWEIVWPVDASLVAMFSRARPDIEFRPIPQSCVDPHDYFINEPVRILVESKCDRIINLYAHFGGINICDMRLDASLKFDEYKYAIAGVPFERKWQLKYQRDLSREEALFEQLRIDRDYVCVHNQGSTMTEPFQIPDSLTTGLQVVKIAPLTDSIFDWRLTLERAKRLVVVDSWAANFIEQLNLENEKAVFLQWGVRFTPVFANGWRFIFPPDTKV
jgi:hypothetical protein